MRSSPGLSRGMSRLQAHRRFPDGPPPRHRTQTWRDLGTSAVLISLWIVPWLLLTAATWIAGGRPSASPISFLNPAQIIRRLESGRRSLRLVGSGCTEAQRHHLEVLGSLAVIAITASAGVVGARVQAQQVSRGRLSRFMSPARRMVRTGRWARGIDLRPMHGRPGRASVFLLGRHGRRMLVNLTGNQRAGDWTNPIREDGGNSAHPQSPRVGWSCHCNEYQERSCRSHGRAPPVYSDRSTCTTRLCEIGGKYELRDLGRPSQDATISIAPGWLHRGCALRCSRAEAAATTIGPTGLNRASC